MSRLLAACVPILMFVPSVRAAAEASMVRYMVGVTPLLLLAGWVLAGLPGPRRLTARWNELGIPGFLITSSVLTVWMIPNALDLATSHADIDAVRTTTTFLAGAALRLSIAQAGLVVQTFFVGHAVTMTVFVGVLFQSMPQRLCNVYLVDDQARTGVGLVVLGSVGGSIWVWSAWRRLQGEASPEAEGHWTEPDAPISVAGS